MRSCPDFGACIVTPASDSTRNKETTKSSLPGTFPETPMNEPDSFSVNPLPATSGPGNPVDVPPGEKLPPSNEVTSNTVQSTVTTSKQDYEKAGSGIPIIGGALAALGLGGAAAASSSDKKENLIPESSLPIGVGAGDTLDAGPTISSAGPTSTTAELAGKVPLEDKKEATVIDPQATTSTVPEVVKESIADAHAAPEATTSAEAVREKAEVEQELIKKVPEHDEAGEPAPTVAATTSTTAPSATGGPSSGAVPGTSSVAAAALADGTDGAADVGEAPKTTAPAEKTEADNTEYAPPHRPAGAPGVSESAAAAVSDGAEDPTLADEPAVQMMNKNEAETSGAPATGAAPVTTDTAATTEAPKTQAPSTAAPESKKEAAATTPGTSSSATTTPTKKPQTTPSSTPSPSATKEKKKKHRISSLFKKIFD